MEGILFLGVMVGAAWLCFWFLDPDAQRKGHWSPFDARQFEDGSQAPAPIAGRNRARGPLPRAWQQRAAPPPARTPAPSGRPPPEPPPWRRRSGF
jgi:hypothetical protein